MVKKVEYYSDNSRYEGDFVNEKRHGKGIYCFSGGGHYEGDFVDGKFNGKGVMVYKDRRYEGDFADGKFRGKIQDSTKIYSESGNAPNGKTDDENPT